MTLDDDALDRLAPTPSWRPDWVDVLGRAGELDQRQWQPWARRRRILELALLAAVLIPLIVLLALAVANGWWLFG